MKTVRDACQVEDNALSIKLSDQIEQLDELITAEADGGAFFERTHITPGLERASGGSRSGGRRSAAGSSRARSR
jgi:hypothetical protein